MKGKSQLAGEKTASGSHVEAQQDRMGAGGETFKTILFIVFEDVVHLTLTVKVLIGLIPNPHTWV